MVTSENYCLPLISLGNLKCNIGIAEQRQVWDTNMLYTSIVLKGMLMYIACVLVPVHFMQFLYQMFYLLVNLLASKTTQTERALEYHHNKQHGLPTHNLFK